MGNCRTALGLGFNEILAKRLMLVPFRFYDLCSHNHVLNRIETKANAFSNCFSKPIALMLLQTLRRAQFCLQLLCSSGTFFVSRRTLFPAVKLVQLWEVCVSFGVIVRNEELRTLERRKLRQLACNEVSLCLIAGLLSSSVPFVIFPCCFWNSVNTRKQVFFSDYFRICARRSTRMYSLGEALLS